MRKLRGLVKRPPLDLGGDKSIAVRRETRTKMTVIRFETNGRAYYIPCDLGNLEIYSFLREAYTGAKNGAIIGPMWINPEVKVSKLTNTELFALSYFAILRFLGLVNTRNIWMVLPKVSNTLISYLKDRISFTELVLPYKVAMIRCWQRSYGLQDISSIEDVFEECGLKRDNSIFYVLSLMTGDLLDFQMDDTHASLSVESLNREADAFSKDPKTMRLCYYHAHKKLSFVAQSHRLDYSDLAVELLSNTLVAFRMVRPMKSLPYSENYARRAMTNTVNRIIYAVSHYDSMKQVWQEEDGSFVSRNVVLSETTQLGVSSGWSDSSAAESSLGFSEDDMLQRIDDLRDYR